MTRMERIAAALARIADLTAEELAELDADIRAEFAELQEQETSADVVTNLQTLATAAQAHQSESTRRADELAALETQRAEAVAVLAAEPDEDESEQGDEPAEVEQPAEQPAADPAEQPAEQPVTASARPAMNRLANRGRTTPRPTAPATPVAPRQRATLTATGRETASRAEISRAFAEEVSRSWGVAGPFRRPVMNAVTEYPEDRRLTDSGNSNEALVASALSGDSLVAAGGLCAPVENLYDVEVMGSTARPVAGALPSFQAARGGINLRPGVYFEDWSGAVGDWTLQNDIDASTAGGADPTKVIMDATCPTFEDFYVEAITARVRFNNVTSRFDPEGTAANLEAVDIWWARYAENKLMAQMRPHMLTVTSPKVLGATRDILVTLDRLISYYRSRHRLEDSVVLDAIMPTWVKDTLRADITRGELSIEALAVADATIASWFTARGIVPVWHLDGRRTAQASGTGIPAIAAQQYAAVASGSAVPEFPDQVEALIYRRGDFLHLDGGTLDLGLVRDSGLNAVNKYEVFKETFEGVAYRGIPGGALQLVATVDPTGLSAGRIDTSATSD